MKPAPFDYVAASTVDDVVRLLATTEREAKVLAGGQSLLPMVNMRLARPELLVDITDVADLGGWWVDDAGLHIGAATRQSTVATAPEIRQGWPLLAAAIEQIGHPQIRNRGTVCGSLAHHDPAAELPAVALVLDARFVITNAAGRRTVAAADFFIGTFQTALGPDDLLTGVVFPPVTGDGWAFAELARTRGDFATVGAAVLLRRRGQKVTAARIACCGVGSTPLRLPATEAELIGHGAGDSGVAAAREAMAALEPPTDVHATGEYRREMAGALVERAIAKAWERSDEQ